MKNINWIWPSFNIVKYVIKTAINADNDEYFDIIEQNIVDLSILNLDTVYKLI